MIYVLNKKTDTKIAFSRDFKSNKFQAWNQLDKEVDPMFIDFIPDELFLKIRKELQENKTTGDLIGWGDNTSTIRRISDYPELRTPNDIVEESLRIWGSSTTNGDVIGPINNDSRSVTFSNDMVERIKRLIGNQPPIQPMEPISDEPYVNQRISNRPNVNYNYVRQFMGGETYLDDLP